MLFVSLFMQMVSVEKMAFYWRILIKTLCGWSICLTSLHTRFPEEANVYLPFSSMNKEY